ncbi:UDP-galactose transporter [Cryptotrichosporon argae]
MGVVRLAVCVSGVYAAFLLWAIAQERLSAPFPSIYPSPHSEHGAGDKFPSPLFLNFAQAVASSACATAYLLAKAVPDGSLRSRGAMAVLGLDRVLGLSLGDKKAADELASKQESKVLGKQEDKTSGQLQRAGGAQAAATGEKRGRADNWTRSLPFLLLQISLFQTTAGPIGFLSLRHISYPTMVLGKSCKLIPVLVLNVLLYRRRFSSSKYLIVALVTIGISMFMLFDPKKGRKGKGGADSAWGLGLLLVNLVIDGLTNSTQDHLFHLHPGFSGQQMMLCMSLMSQLLLLPLLVLPLPAHASSLLALFPTPLSSSAVRPPVLLSPPALSTSLAFVRAHPSALAPLLAYAALGGVGQLFIFETIAHFGSLTLVMVTVTRKLFTMLLSVAVYRHQLAPGQWAGVAVVFAGIGVEAGIKRRDVMRKARRDKAA